MLSTQVSVEAAHFIARVLKRKPFGEGGGMPNKFGVAVIYIFDWNFGME